MRQLSSADRRALRARAHALHPLVIVSGAGLSDSVLGEIERCLDAHELIKIRVPGENRLQREDLLAQICERTEASPVQHIGKILVVYRERPASPAPVAKSKAKAPPRRKPGAASRSKPTHAGPPGRSPSRPASRRRP